MKRFGTGLVMAVLLGLIPIASATAAQPSTEKVYAEGQSYTMLGVTLKTQASPGLLNKPPLYILGFVPSASLLANGTLTSGYAPQCDPCDHSPFVYHDHVLTGAPGLGSTGTGQGAYSAPWRLVVMLYNPAWSNSPSFTPITRDDDIPAAEAAGHFLPINPGAPDPFQVWTTQVLICPLIRAG